MHILLAGPAGLLPDGVARILRDMDPAAEVTCVDYAGAVLDTSAPADLVVLDGDYQKEALQAIDAIHKRVPAPPIVVLLTTTDPNTVENLIASGVTGCFDKSESSSVLLDALRLVLSGGIYLPRALVDFAVNQHGPREIPHAKLDKESQDSPRALTPRQIEVLARAARGESNKTIARHLDIAEGTVKVHLYTAYKALKVSSRSQASVAATRLKTVADEQIRQALEGQLSVGRLLGYMTRTQYRRGETLFRKGDPADALYYVVRGTIRLKEIDVDVGPGTMLGEIGLFSPDHRRTCTARCETDTELLTVTATDAMRLYYQDPEFAVYLIHLITRRLEADKRRSSP